MQTSKPDHERRDSPPHQEPARSARSPRIERALTREWDQIRALRAEITHLALESGGDHDYADQCAMSASELLENAIKYAAPGEITLRIEFDARDRSMQIEVENSATPGNIEDLRLALEQVRSGPAMEAYMLLLREASGKDEDKSGLGLGRIRAEGNAEIMDEIDGTRVRISARVVRRKASDPDLDFIYGRRATDEPRKRRAQFFLTFTHWSAVGLIGLGLATGVRISWAFEASPLGGGGAPWSPWLNWIAPQGALVDLHVLSAWGLALVAAVYVAYLLKSGESRRVRIQRADASTVLEAMRSRSFLADKQALWAANVLVNWIMFAMIGVLFLSGVILYQRDWHSDDLFGGYLFLRLAHAVIAYLFIPYTIVHVFLEWKFGILWSIFRAAFYRKRLRAGLVGTAIAAALIGALAAWNGVPEELEIVRLPSGGDAPVLDGDARDPAWKSARPVVVSTAKGANFPETKTDVSIAALHDAERVYFLFQWDDPDVSGKRYPLLKTEEGWRMLGTGYEAADEVEWYEDKLAVYLTDVPNRGCVSSCHLGKDPVGIGQERTWGLHYTEGEIADVWHWKWVRSNWLGEPYGEPGYMDDQYFGPPEPLEKFKGERYTAGYNPDPDLGGGYRYNFVKVGKEKQVAESEVRPLKLPRALPADERLMEPSAASHGTWWIQDKEGLEYAPEKDTLPVGTMIPNILLSPFTGDRSHIRAKGAWKDGRWTLEVSRLLDTKSAFDVAFRGDRPLYLSVGAFDRVQTRHTEHFEPVRVVLRD